MGRARFAIIVAFDFLPDLRHVCADLVARLATAYVQENEDYAITTCQYRTDFQRLAHEPSAETTLYICGPTLHGANEYEMKSLLQNLPNTNSIVVLQKHRTARADIWKDVNANILLLRDWSNHQTREKLYDYVATAYVKSLEALATYQYFTDTIDQRIKNALSPFYAEQNAGQAGRERTPEYVRKIWDSLHQQISTVADHHFQNALAVTKPKHAQDQPEVPEQALLEAEAELQIAQALLRLGVEARLHALRGEVNFQAFMAAQDRLHNSRSRIPPGFGLAPNRKPDLRPMSHMQRMRRRLVESARWWKRIPARFAQWLRPRFKRAQILVRVRHPIRTIVHAYRYAERANVFQRYRSKHTRYRMVYEAKDIIRSYNQTWHDWDDQLQQARIPRFFRRQVGDAEQLKQWGDEMGLYHAAPIASQHEPGWIVYATLVKKELRYHYRDALRREFWIEGNWFWSILLGCVNVFAGYGLRPGRIFGWVMTMPLFFALAYRFSDQTVSNCVLPSQQASFLTYLSFSITTLTTQGFTRNPHILCSPFSDVLICIEAIMGFFLLAMLSYLFIESFFDR